jgi:hypothetical protein
MNVNKLKVGGKVSRKGNVNVCFTTLHMFEPEHKRIYGEHLNEIYRSTVRKSIVLYISSDYILARPIGASHIDILLNEHFS